MNDSRKETVLPSNRIPSRHPSDRKAAVQQRLEHHSEKPRKGFPLAEHLSRSSFAQQGKTGSRRSVEHSVSRNRRVIFLNDTSTTLPEISFSSATGTEQERNGSGGRVPPVNHPISETRKQGRERCSKGMFRFLSFFHSFSTPDPWAFPSRLRSLDVMTRLPGSERWIN